MTKAQQTLDDQLAGAEAKRDATLLALDLAQIEKTAQADFQYALDTANHLKTYNAAAIDADYSFTIKIDSAQYAYSQKSAQSEKALNLGLEATNESALVQNNAASYVLNARLTTHGDRTINHVPSNTSNK
ncbi:hypothetical protein [Blastopirellula marina]|uniref:Uncharacterized protein n=1 Tax=Blastopirellula marina DSM 3645 TaxID=314230 RepID=A3ZWD9_9BACT|nr:hypothetical protein [Blastopirellula marina]EAQ79167.1 hypothetical protein DSM3645_26129 [Blastopirellula marina DSM 3645]